MMNDLTKKFVTAIGGIDVFGLICILLFLAVFVGVIIWAFTRRQDFLTNMSALPLEDGEKISQPRNPL
jgi:cbb3-type cytochrome oxidase subunit 3